MATTEIQTSKMDQSEPGDSRVNHSIIVGRLWQVLLLLPFQLNNIISWSSTSEKVKVKVVKLGR
jgi:hypothetical protein